MRLWHFELIPHLSNQRLLGQHRECCALRGNGWNKPHATVNYVFKHSPLILYNYHTLVMDELAKRNYRIDPLWRDPKYRGKKCEPYIICVSRLNGKSSICIYPEHNEAYLNECLRLLAERGETI